MIGKERLKETSEIAIHICILTMNLWRRLKEFLLRFLLVSMGPMMTIM